MIKLALWVGFGRFFLALSWRRYPVFCEAISREKDNNRIEILKYEITIISYLRHLSRIVSVVFDVLILSSRAYRSYRAKRIYLQ